MKKNNSKLSNLFNDRKISEILKNLPDNFSGSVVTIGELKDILSRRVYGIFFLILAFPNLIPLPAPGLSTILGAPLTLMTFQLMLGLKIPWLPKFIARRKIKHEKLKSICTHIIPYLKKLEYIVKPRLKFLIIPSSERFIGFLCLFLSLMIMLPIPFGNALPALAICFFAIGMLQRDGVFVIFGIITMLISILVISTFLGALFLSISKFLDI